MKHTVNITFELKDWMFYTSIGNPVTPNMWMKMDNENDFMLQCIEEFDKITEWYAADSFLDQPL